MKQKSNIEKAPDATPQERHDEGTPAVGKWYWVKGEPDGYYDEPYRWLACVVHMGSNYVKMRGLSEDGRHEFSSRIHFDNFWSECTYVAEPIPTIKEKIEDKQRRVSVLMNEVKRLAGKLGVGPLPELTQGSQTQALATREGEPIPEYRKALVVAKEETFPELFKEMKKEMGRMERWMKLESVPLEAHRDSLEQVIRSVNKKILAVDLYAGLSEDANQVKKGKPADISEPIHLLQRRCYMDEECLAQYKIGGMEFRDIRAFDKWLAKKDNRDRLLPFPRCIVAFRVRRHDKEREVVNLHDFFRIINLRDQDKATFLYVRNGGQIWRVNTRIDFGEKLFPDFDKQLITSGQKIWAKEDFGKFTLISDNEYRAIKAEEKRKLREWKKLSKEEKGLRLPPYRFGRDSSEYSLFNKDNVYYDDIAEAISKTIEDYNRIAMIIQGFLDRSPILHPHPPWKIWTNDGFAQALRLIYDESRALVTGEIPDFEVYRARLNASLLKGSVTVGQGDAWVEYETEKEHRRLDADWRAKSDYRPTSFHPYGNPGPGLLARVEKFSKGTKKCTYRWERKRLVYSPYRDGLIPAKFSCPVSKVLNVDAYKPGDFKIFFNDPRTRIQYLKWAPLLLTAEEYHAGNLEVGPE